MRQKIISLHIGYFQGRGYSRNDEMNKGCHIWINATVEMFA